MVGGFVDQQTAAVFLVAMPSAEIVRTVIGIQKPLEMNAGNLSDESASEDLLDPGIAGRVAVIECDGDIASGFLLCIKDLLTFFRINGHGFFRDDIASELHGTADILVMRAVNGCHNDFIRFDFGDHAIEFDSLVGRQRCMTVMFCNVSVVKIHPVLIAVAKSAEFSRIGKIFHQRVDVHPGTLTGSDVHITNLTHFLPAPCALYLGGSE